MSLPVTSCEPDWDVRWAVDTGSGACEPFSDYCWCSLESGGLCGRA